MRIAFIVESFPKLSETFIISQISGLINRGHNVDIYADILLNERKTHPDVDRNDLLENTFYLKKSSGKISNLIRAFYLSGITFSRSPQATLKAWTSNEYDKVRVFPRHLLPLLTAKFIEQSKRYDIVHCHFGRNGLKAAFLKRIGLIDSPIITTFHGIDMTTDIDTFGKNMYSQLFEVGDLFLPISRHWEKKLIEIGCDQQKIDVHHMGVNCEKFTFNHRSLSKSSPIRLISIARLVEKKGIEYAIRAVVQLKRIYPNIIYVIIGDGKLRQRLEGLVESLNISDNIIFLGWREPEEVINELSQADILLAPSVTSQEGDQEGIPVTLMEAMAMGIPVISTWHSGIPELVENGISGYLVAEKDANALARKVEHLVGHPKIYSSMSLSGRLRVEESFNLESLNNQLVRFYSNLLSKKQSCNE